MVAAIERGFPQREIADSAYRFQQAVESREQIIVGVNEYTSPGDDSVRILYIDESAGERQLDKLAALRRTRDQARVMAALDALRHAAQGTANTMPALLDACRAYATIGEMCDALRDVWGECEEVPII